MRVRRSLALSVVHVGPVPPEDRASARSLTLPGDRAPSNLEGVVVDLPRDGTDDIVDLKCLVLRVEAHADDADEERGQ